MTCVLEPKTTLICVVVPCGMVVAVGVSRFGIGGGRTRRAVAVNNFFFISPAKEIGVITYSVTSEFSIPLSRMISQLLRAVSSS